MLTNLNIDLKINKFNDNECKKKLQKQVGNEKINKKEQSVTW